MKIRVLNVKYSKNVGDGIIGECIEYFLNKSTGADVKSVDLSMKSKFPDGDVNRVGKGYVIYKVIDMLPRKARQFVTSKLVPMMIKPKLSAFFSRELNDTDVMVIGGGQLFQDKKMYFPPRILLALKNLNPKADVYIYAVGVAPEWTKEGREFVEQILNDSRIKGIFVRDEESKTNLIDNFKLDQAKIDIAFDPGLMSKTVYKDLIAGTELPANTTVGIGISCTDEIRDHSSRNSLPVLITKKQYIELIQRLSITHKVHVFTNGGDADHKLFIDVKNELRSDSSSNITFVGKPLTPSDLVSIIAGVDVVLSHRLHANIVGYSLDKTIIGFVWDKKLNSFFTNIGRECFIKSTFDIDELINDVDQSHRGINETAIIDEATESLNKIATSIMEHQG